MRHAYLIMCHNNFDGLKRLISLLDDERNDIYIHVDRKVKAFPRKSIESVAQKSGIFFVRRVNVAWAGYSQIKAEMELLKSASANRYQYYHLLSGNDLPIKDQDKIHSFFSANNGKQFISVDDSKTWEMDFTLRVKEYHFFQNYIGRNKGLFVAVISYLESVQLNLQKKMGIDRRKKWNAPIYKGGQWFSITDSMVQYVIEHRKEWEKRFRFGVGVDELFLQTIAMNSSFGSMVTGNAMRLIDWNRGRPYTFTLDDYEMLMSSDRLFARKFDYENCPEIVDQIVSYLLA